MRGLWLIALSFLLSGCSGAILDPAGDIAVQERDLIIQSTILMLLIIVPVMLLTVVFAWRYRASNTEATYTPDWNHSTQLELVIWSAPLLIIIALGALTWITTHTLDPFRPLSRLDEQRPLPADAKVLTVQVVAMDWKWLFIYPEYGVATVNELAAPVDVPVRFDMTATSVMNTLSIPAVAGMIYAMPAMKTQLNVVVNRPGNYEGFSANYSGAGFSDMKFRMYGLSPADFEAWIAKAKESGKTLDRAEYLALAKPSTRAPIARFASVETGLFDAVLNRCVESGKMCIKDMMAIDARGGLGLAGIYNIGHLFDKPDGRGTEYVLALCATGGAASNALSPMPTANGRVETYR